MFLPCFVFDKPAILLDVQSFDDCDYPDQAIVSYIDTGQVDNVNLMSVKLALECLSSKDKHVVATLRLADRLIKRKEQEMIEGKGHVR